MAKKKPIFSGLTSTSNQTTFFVTATGSAGWSPPSGSGSIPRPSRRPRASGRSTSCRGSSSRPDFASNAAPGRANPENSESKILRTRPWRKQTRGFILAAAPERCSSLRRQLIQRQKLRRDDRRRRQLRHRPLGGQRRRRREVRTTWASTRPKNRDRYFRTKVRTETGTIRTEKRKIWLRSRI